MGRRKRHQSQMIRFSEVSTTVTLLVIANVVAESPDVVAPHIPAAYSAVIGKTSSELFATETGDFSDEANADSDRD